MKPLLVPLSAALDRITQRLVAVNLENSAREAQLLVAYAIGCGRSKLVTMDRSTLIDWNLVEPLLDRREQHEPFAYLTGHKEFWSLDLKVSSETLIPRADSEVLIESLCEISQNIGDLKPHILDIGTGSGCLLLAMLKEMPNATGVGVDVSWDAVILARENAVLNHMSQRCRFVCGYWGEAIKEKFDLILSNPPYIPTTDITRLAATIRHFEPHLALDGGADGLRAYRQILPGIDKLMKPEGLIALEVGIGQAKAVRQIGIEVGLVPVVTKKDLSGIERVIVFRVASDGR